MKKTALSWLLAYAESTLWEGASFTKHTVQDNSLDERKAVKHKIITKFSMLKSLLIIQKLPYPSKRDLIYKRIVVHLVKSFAAF